MGEFKSLSGMATPISNPTPLYEHEAAEPEMRMTVASESRPQVQGAGTMQQNVPQAGEMKQPVQGAGTMRSLAQMATPLGYREGESSTVGVEELVKAGIGVAETGKKYGEAALAGVEKLKELRQKKLVREAMGEAGVEMVPKPKSLLETMFPAKPKERPLEEAGIEVM